MADLRGDGASAWMPDQQFDELVERLRGIQDDLKCVDRKLNLIIRIGGYEMSLADDLNVKLQALAAEQAQNANVVDSAKKTLTVLVGEVADLTAKLTAGATVTQAMVDQAQGLVDAFTANTNDLASGIANVPAPPAPPAP